jgi:DnaJ-domain-containing protein 1
MEGRFFGVRGARSVTKEFDEAVPAVEPNRPRQNWQFVSDFQMQMGEGSEPDPQFFVESWTLGVTAAMDNLQKRQQGQAARARNGQGLREIQALGTLAFLQEQELGAEFHSSVVMGECEDRCEPSQPLLSGNETVAAYAQTEQEWDSLAEECESSVELGMPMTRERALRLLEVTPASTRIQIKAAYRRKVSHWHPDRLAHRSEEVRQLATRQMTAINEAYRLLRD